VQITVVTTSKAIHGHHASKPKLSEIYDCLQGGTLGFAAVNKIE